MLVSELIQWQHDNNVSIWLSQINTLVTEVDSHKIKLKISKIIPVAKEFEKQLTLAMDYISAREIKLTLNEAIKYLNTGDTENAIKAMSKQIIIAVATEGTTDIRFLESIIQRTFEKIAFDCSDLVEVFAPIFLEKVPGYIEAKALNYASQAIETGAMILCLHVDADAQTDEIAFADRIDPAFQAIANTKEYQELHDTLIAIVPVQMTEAWMLADRELLKKELGTKKNNDELGINKLPESFSDPKQAIQKAIQVAKQELSKRRRYKLKIGDLYQPLGQKVDLEYLESLPYYQKFQNAVRDVFIKLNYLKF